MKQFLIVLKFELSNYFKNKSFVITTFILALLIVAIVVVPTMVPGFLNNSTESTEVEEEAFGEYGLLVTCDKEQVNVDAICEAFPAKWSIFE